MSNPPDFGDLRSLLNQHHTPQVWDQLCQWISAFDDDASKQRILPYIEGHLLKWSDKERVAPRAWVQHLLNDQPTPWLFIARSISMRGWDSSVQRSWRSHTLNLSTFAARQELEHLHFLDLGHNALQDNELKPLLVSPYIKNLKGLDLQRNELTHTSLQQLTSSSAHQALQELSLRQNKLGHEGIRALLSQPWPSLQSLDLSGAALDGSSLSLLSNAQLPALEHLILSKNLFKAEQLRQLELPSLKTLNLDQCHLGESGAQQLAATNTIANLEHLSLWSCELNDAGLRAILQHHKLDKLTSLNLGKNKLGAPTLKLLSKLALPSLKTLNLYHNPLDDKCYTQLAQASWLPQLEQLLLGADQASNAAKTALQRSPLLPSHLHLSLS